MPPANLPGAGERQTAHYLNEGEVELPWKQPKTENIQKLVFLESPPN